ncbi:Bug family tripartite tricarboxylate transporter substrate binding protein [Marinobacter sp. X15-166B]|uniref:Bug family tripartite tricarboxylate transporter substrate binding protein n=1 Tax=Marinobacter sp. X15-166B TaxID=1897620 RepID=UPI00085C6499|nr:tripartite tricarboxylate transporter substrate binding protein [Marinobacter sp. X15-166B]OEY66111.1 hypothetical protein BG841_06325 [Marinobacter sp. X15-166B]
MKKINVLFAALIALLAAMPGLTTADNFPQRPIELIVPFGAGGTTDVFARSFARVLGKYLPHEQRVVVVNKPGGATTIGMSVLAAAKPDGYTLGLSPSGTIEVMQHYGRTRWTADSFEPILAVLDIPASINVLDSSEFENYAQWKQYVEANPGKFTFTTSGATGGSAHLAMEQFMEKTGLKLRHIPFEGHAASQAAVLGGQVMGSFAMPNLHQGGEIRPLVFLTDAKPLGDDYADTPVGSSLDTPVTASFPMGVFAPKGIPADRVAILHDAFKAAMDDPDVIRFYETSGLPRVYQDGETFAAGIRQRSAANKRLLKQMGLIK